MEKLKVLKSFGALTLAPEAIARFKSDIKPLVLVSQNISKLDSTGLVSATIKLVENLEFYRIFFIGLPILQFLVICVNNK